MSYGEQVTEKVKKKKKNKKNKKGAAQQTNQATEDEKAKDVFTEENKFHFPIDDEQSLMRIEEDDSDFQHIQIQNLEERRSLLTGQIQFNKYQDKGIGYDDNDSIIDEELGIYPKANFAINDSQINQEEHPSNSNEPSD